MIITPEQATQFAKDVLLTHGVAASNVEILCDLIVRAECEGSRSHGLMRLPDYVASIRAGWLDGAAVPDVVTGELASIEVDCRNGFTQVADVMARQQLLEKAKQFGMAMLSVKNGHHIGALWLDIVPLAEAGMVAINYVNSRCRLAPYGATKRLIGTNAMAFSAPDGNGGALAWDQASGVMSLGDIKLHAAANQPLPPGVGLDSQGRHTQIAADVLNGGAILPFGGHKGASIAVMVEVMAAAMTGANFGFEDNSKQFPGAASSNAGQLVVVFDPQAATGVDIAGRMKTLMRHLREGDNIRLPGDRRAEMRIRAETVGIELTEAEYALLTECTKDPATTQYVSP
ncbi:Ldh family oxidoreductase [Paraburkholderia sp. J8-2]|uniref:Ldh family oxidoreductase n=1 Tax=Paraburkholderia sp. J8-2 TaxID=2805440 RepID=UPI002AB6A9F6|nr:Ldh family oxidoreductase [Paraburkholderia sp. J8-2]